SRRSAAVRSVTHAKGRPPCGGFPRRLPSAPVGILGRGRYPQGADPRGPTINTPPTGIPVRELERTAADNPQPPVPASAGSLRIGVVGAGRVGHALATALRAAGHEVEGPAGRGETPAGDVLLLCVPDAEIESAATALSGSASVVGHTSGATPLSALAPARADAFGLHPLQTLAGP